MLVEPVFQDKNRFIFNEKEQAIKWCQVNVLDNGFTYSEPEQLPETNQWRIEVSQDD